MSIARFGHSSLPAVAKRLEADGERIFFRYGVFVIIPTFAVATVALLLVLFGPSNLLVPEDGSVWGWPLLAQGENARGWVSIGARSVGLIAVGQQPTGVVAMGWFPVGVFSVSPLFSFGVFPVGGVAVGLVSMGPFGSAGWLSFGPASLGWYAYGEGISVGAYAWGHRAYGYFFAHSCGPWVRAQRKSSTVAQTSMVAPTQERITRRKHTALPPLAEWLSRAGGRFPFQFVVVAGVLTASCGPVILLAGLGVLDPQAWDAGLLGWRELIAPNDEPWRWISIGERPRGVIAIGQQPTGVIALGVIPIGVLSLGVFPIGLFSVGCGALGLVSLGFFAAGWLAFGTLSVGWYARADGGVALGAYAWGGRPFGFRFAHLRRAQPGPGEWLLGDRRRGADSAG